MNRPHSSPEETEARIEMATKITSTALQNGRRPPKKRPPLQQDETATESFPNKRARFDEEKLEARRVSNSSRAAKLHLEQKQAVAKLETMLAIEQKEKEILQLKVESLNLENHQLRVIMSQQQKVALNRNRTLQQLLANYVQQLPCPRQKRQPQVTTTPTTGSRRFPGLVRPTRSASLSSQTSKPTHASCVSLSHDEESTQYLVQGQGPQYASETPECSMSPQLSTRLRPPSPVSTEQESSVQNQIQDLSVQQNQYSTGASTHQENSGQVRPHGFSLTLGSAMSSSELCPHALRDREPKPQRLPLATAIERMPIATRIQFLQRELDIIMKKRRREKSTS